MNLKELIDSSTQYLRKSKIRYPRKIVEQIFAYVLKISRFDLYFTQKEIEEKHLKEMKNLLKKRAKGTPIEYLLGEIDFYQCKIHVSSSVLIPRPETEILFELFAKKLFGIDLTEKVLFDLCTGSGCLGIAAKKTYPMLDVFLSDISDKALKVAKKNAEENRLQVQLLKGSLFSPYKTKRADFILCNPPYLSKKEYEECQNTWEPKAALLAGDTGLEFYEKIAKKLLDYVNPKAKIFMEIGYNQAEDIKRIFQKIPYRKLEIQKDYSGLDRFFFLEIE